MMAPTRVPGGITTWLRILRKYSDAQHMEYRIIDTAKVYQPLGEKLNFVGAVMGIRDAIVQLFLLLWLIATFRPNLVYFTCAPSIGFVVRQCTYLFILRVMGVPTLIHLRGGKVEKFFGGGFVRKGIACAGARCARAVLVITREVQKEAIRVVGRRRVFYVPNMIDDDALAIVPPRRLRGFHAPDKIQLLHVGWQAPEKGSIDLVEALAHVSKPVDCNMVGVCADENRVMIEEAISRQNLGQVVRLAGIKRGRELAECYERADLFVFPTHSEGFPNAVLEAMSYGLPVVSTDVGNIREMLGVDTRDPAGVVLDKVNPIDPRELARKIEDLIASPSLRQRMCRSGMRRARALYSAGKVVPELERLVGRVAADARPRQGAGLHPKLRVAVVAPMRGSGGITPWLGALWMASNPRRMDLQIIDSSRPPRSAYPSMPTLRIKSTAQSSQHARSPRRANW